VKHLKKNELIICDMGSQIIHIDYTTNVLMLTSDCIWFLFACYKPSWWWII